MMYRLVLAGIVATLIGITNGAKQFSIRSECATTYGTPIGSPFKISSHIYCAVKCQETAACKSFMFSNETFECWLNSETNDCPSFGCISPRLYGAPRKPEPTNCVTSFANEKVRLWNGSGGQEGRVEVFHEGNWCTVCDDRVFSIGYWIFNPMVVCRMFGYNYGIPHGGSAFGQGQDCILQFEVQCFGIESSIFDCPWITRVRNCDHGKDIGVSCYNLPY